MEAFRVKNGLQAGRYLGSNGVETAGLGPAYDIGGASYDGVSFSVAGQESVPSGLFFKPDGTKMYVIGYANDNVNEYDLSTPWDVSTASFLQLFSVATQDTTPTVLFFKPDGTKMYVVGYSGQDVNEYNLSTAWDITTASFLQSFSVSAQDTSPWGIFFKPDGTKMYVLGLDGDDVNEYDLSTPWDITTASFLQLFSVSAQDIVPRDVFFKPDGTKMYIVGDAGDDVNEYDLSTPWDITTASFLQNFSVAAQETSSQGIFFKPDGTKMYVIGLANDTIYQYSTILSTAELDLSTGTTFSFTPSGASSTTTVLFTNPPATGNAIGFSLEVIGDGSAIAWPTSVKWHEATAPTATISKELYAFVTTDGGTTYYGRKAAEDIA